MSETKPIITRGLVVKRHWLDLILCGRKSWEIRGSDTKVRGMIALVESGSGEVKGLAVLRDSFAVSLADLMGNPSRHRIPPGAKIRYARPHAWVLSPSARLSRPIPYRHPRGAVIWVTLGRENMGDGFGELQRIGEVFGGAA